MLVDVKFCTLVNMSLKRSNVIYLSTNKDRAKQMIQNHFETHLMETKHWMQNDKKTEHIATMSLWKIL